MAPQKSASSLILSMAVASCAALVAVSTFVWRRKHRHNECFQLEEMSVSQLQRAYEQGELTAEKVVRMYSERIGLLNERLSAVYEINPDAIEIAKALDKERIAGRVRGPLHGVPVLIKGNVGTHDKMQTTAGSTALIGAIPENDAHIVKLMREAGVIILGKTNLSGWANFQSTASISGWSACGKQVRNPYALDRNPSGSSSGTGAAVSANLAIFGIGTETDGSIVSPASHCGLVGVKPTIGLVSRRGIVPISSMQDTAGPMARTVEDAAYLLTAIVGSDAEDPVTASAQSRKKDFTKFLRRDGLKGARIGVITNIPNMTTSTERILKRAVNDIIAAGAECVDVEFPNIGGFDDDEFLALLHEFKHDLNRYLSELGPHAKVHSLEDVIEYNKKHEREELLYFSQEIFEKAQATGGLEDPKYKQARENCLRMTRKEGIDALLEQNNLNALVAITTSQARLIDSACGDAGGNPHSSSLAAVSGYPSVCVVGGYVRGLPVGLSFIGAEFSESTLLQYAYAFEQRTLHRRVPQLYDHIEQSPYHTNVPESAALDVHLSGALRSRCSP